MKYKEKDIEKLIPHKVVWRLRYSLCNLDKFFKHAIIKRVRHSYKFGKSLKTVLLITKTETTLQHLVLLRNCHSRFFLFTNYTRSSASLNFKRWRMYGQYSQFSEF